MATRKTRAQIKREVREAAEEELQFLIERYDFDDQQAEEVRESTFSEFQKMSEEEWEKLLDEDYAEQLAEEARPAPANPAAAATNFLNWVFGFVLIAVVLFVALTVSDIRAKNQASQRFFADPINHQKLNEQRSSRIKTGLPQEIRERLTPAQRRHYNQMSNRWRERR